MPTSKGPGLKKIPMFFLCLALPALVWPGSPEETKPQPFETRMDLGLFGLLDGGMRYSLGGKPISRYEDFKSLIYAKNDTEASDLIREAHEAHFVAWMLYVAGAATGVDIGLSFKPAPVLHIDWFDRIATGVVAGQVFWAVGAIFDTNAEGRKYNAVQRYNQLLRDRNQSFLGFSPQVCLGGQGFSLDLNHPF
jgi:hypothetical protein